MFKHILIAVLSILLFSCQTGLNDKKNDPTKEINLNDKTPQEKQSYETINSEEQAKEINKANQEQEQEIEVQDRVFFSLNSSEIEEEAKKILEVQVEWLKSDNKINVTIEGHCDERGSREFNIALGEKRAFAVKKFLKQRGIADSRIKIVSYGKERPAFVGNSDEIHAKNRRAVTVIN